MDHLDQLRHSAAQGQLHLGIMQDDKVIFDNKLAKQAGERGMDRATNPYTQWYAEADEWIRYRMHVEFTADDLVEEIGLPIDLDGTLLSNNGIGAYFNHLARRNPPCLKQIGYEKSSRVSNHGRILRLWKVIGRP